MGVFLVALHNPAAAQAGSTTYNFQYDAAGNLIKLTNPLGHSTIYTYDLLNRRSSETNSNNGVSQFGHDGLNQQISVSDPRGLSTNYGIDGLGNQVVLSSPDTGETKKSFDALGNITSITDAKGQSTSYKYDVLSRITLITYHDGTTLSYVYDQGENGIGRLTEIRGANSSIVYAYDPYGRIINDTRVIGDQVFVTSYQYDDAGRLSGMTYPSGRKIEYARDAVGRVSKISVLKDGASATLINSVTYLPFGSIQTVTFSNGKTYNRAYDLEGRIASFTLGAQTQTVNYDAASHIISIGDANNSAATANYGYDPLGRITSVSKPYVGIGYSYDQVGNMLTRSVGAAMTIYSYGATSNRLIQAVGKQFNTITSDANGSITDNGVNKFTYDVKSRLVSADTAIGLVRYEINGLGQRMRKITPSGATAFHYDTNGKLIAESNAVGFVEYVYLNDLPVAVLK
jgi:YD repeat-containing protein